MGQNPGTRVVTKIIFPTADMAASVEFYQRLGFTVEQFDDGYAWVSHRGEELLHLAGHTELDRQANRAAGYLHVQDTDAWHTAWADAGVETTPVVDQPWQMREFSLHDPSGNLLRVGQNLS